MLRVTSSLTSIVSVKALPVTIAVNGSEFRFSASRTLNVPLFNVPPEISTIPSLSILALKPAFVSCVRIWSIVVLPLTVTVEVCPLEFLTVKVPPL